MKDVREKIKEIWNENTPEIGFWIADIIVLMIIIFAIYISGFFLIFINFI